MDEIKGKEGYGWWRITDPLLVGVTNALSSAYFDVGTKEWNEVNPARRYILLWLIWTCRNKLVNGSVEQRREVLHEDIFASMKVLAHLRLSKRGAKIITDFDIWRQNSRILIG